MPICPSCGNKTADNAIFCDQCGTKLPASAVEETPTAVAEAPVGAVPEGVLICPDCGAENVPGEVFCDTCGSPLQAPEPVAPAQAPVAEAAPVTQAAQTGVPFCPTCGAQVNAGDTFCGSCGASLAAPAEEVVPEVEPLPEEPVVEPVAQEVVEEVVVEEVVAEEAPIEEPVEEIAVAEPEIIEVPVEEVVAEPVTLESEAVAAAEELRCPVCGEKAAPGQAFCAVCGASLQGVVAEAVTAPEAVVPEVAAQAAVVGPCLEIVESGAQIPLPDQPELLIGREDEVSGVHPDIDMTPHRGEEGGISRRHARLVCQGSMWSIVDLDSTNGTYVNGTELQPKVPAPLHDGDRIGLGDIEAVFHAG
jgi:predicted amidophosphoribosyltransferase